MRRAGSGMPTKRQHLDRPAHRAASRSRPWCSRSVSPICRPTVSTGFRLVIGSWKIIEIALPRMARISASDRASRSRPSKRMRPATIWPGGCRDQPQDRHRGDRLAAAGLSPTIASVSPARHVKRHALDRAHHAVAGAEMGLQVLDLEQRAALASPAQRGSKRCASRHSHIRFARRGSSASRSPSPSRFTASTVTDSKIAGKNTM